MEGELSRKPIDISKLFALWNTQASNAEICLAIGVARSTLDVLRMRHKLPRRPRIKREKPESVDDSPSIEEITARAAEVRSGWSEDEEQRRIVGKGRARWSPPRYCFDGRDTAFVGVSH